MSSHNLIELILSSFFKVFFITQLYWMVHKNLTEMFNSKLLIVYKLRKNMLVFSSDLYFITNLFCQQNWSTVYSSVLDLIKLLVNA